MTIVLFDTPISRHQLFPISLTRPIATTRHGIFSGIEWYAYMSNLPVVTLSEDYLMKPLPKDSNYLCIDASIIPNAEIFHEIMHLEPGEMLEDDSGIIAFHSLVAPVFGSLPIFMAGKKAGQEVKRISHPMDWVKTNAAKILADIHVLKNQLVPLANNGSNKIFGSHPVWVDAKANIKGCTFNTEDGPIFIGSQAFLMEGSFFRGPLSIGEKAVIKMGTQIYGGTTIGVKCTAGGEIKNSILGDYSNKAHHGYLGDSLVGQWCNLGAGTTNSNVKNNAGIIKMWSALSRSFIPVGQKAGMVMGDFTKTAINTSINTGTTIGVGCSLHYSGPTGKVVPSFTWGMADQYDPVKLFQDIKQWMAFKQEITDPELAGILKHVFPKVPPTYDENHG